MFGKKSHNVSDLSKDEQIAHVMHHIRHQSDINVTNKLRFIYLLLVANFVGLAAIGVLYFWGSTVETSSVLLIAAAVIIPFYVLSFTSSVQAVIFARSKKMRINKLALLSFAFNCLIAILIVEAAFYFWQRN